MPSAVWSGHLHFGLVAMPVRLLVAARTKTTRFRRLYRKPLDADSSATVFPSFSQDSKNQNSDSNDGIGEMRSTPEEKDTERTASDQYSAVRQVLQSEVTGEEIRPDERDTIVDRLVAGTSRGKSGADLQALHRTSRRPVVLTEIVQGYKVSKCDIAVESRGCRAIIPLCPRHQLSPLRDDPSPSQCSRSKPERAQC